MRKSPFTVLSSIFYIYPDLAYLICIVNSATSSNLTLVPRQPRPVQGKRPEAASCSSPPPLWNVASGLPSHQQPRTVVLRSIRMVTCHTPKKKSTKIFVSHRGDFPLAEASREMPADQSPKRGPLTIGQVRLQTALRIERNTTVSH
jgi:hypothetical protein